MKQYKANSTGELVEAVQWDGSGVGDKSETSGLSIIRWVRATSSEPDGGVTRNWIHLPGGERVSPLDFIVKDSAGAFKAYSHKAFESEFTEDA